MINDETLQLAKKLWDYHHVNHALEKADCILALGSHDLRVAERAAELHLQSWAPLIIFSGGLGNLTKGMWTETEADQFAAKAIRMGVPKTAILVENRSTNTGENIRFHTTIACRKKFGAAIFYPRSKALTWKEEVMRHSKNTGPTKN
jgi:uncharacterized SAM-binding protein YcdF (DUF218 family)